MPPFQIIDPMGFCSHESSAGSSWRLGYCANFMLLASWLPCRAEYEVTLLCFSVALSKSLSFNRPSPKTQQNGRQSTLSNMQQEGKSRFPYEKLTTVYLREGVERLRQSDLQNMSKTPSHSSICYAQKAPDLEPTWY